MKVMASTATKERPVSTTWVQAENKHVSDAHNHLLEEHDYFHGSTNNSHHLSAQEVWQRIDFMKVSEKTP